MTRKLLKNWILLVCASAGTLGMSSPLGLMAQTPKAPLHLEDGTPVRLRLSRTLSSASAQTDDRVDFDVLEEIKVGGIVVVPKGSVAWGTVTNAEAKRRMGRGGKLDVNIDAMRLADGEKAALRGVKNMKGGGHTGAMTGAMVATSLVAWPAAPLFLFMHGKDVTIPKGTELTVYLNGDLDIDPAKFSIAPPTLAAATGGVPTVQPEAAAQPTAQHVADVATTLVKSSPNGADIMVDGKYLGSTPSTLKLLAGDHRITVAKPGFSSWEREVSVGPGSDLTIEAALDKRR